MEKSIQVNGGEILIIRQDSGKVCLSVEDYLDGFTCLGGLNKSIVLEIIQALTDSIDGREL